MPGAIVPVSPTVPQQNYVFPGCGASTCRGYGFGLAGRMSAGALQQARHLASHTPHMACPGFDVGEANVGSVTAARAARRPSYDVLTRHTGVCLRRPTAEEWLSKGSAMIGRRVASFNLLVALGTVVAWLPDNEEGDPALYHVVHDGDGDVRTWRILVEEEHTRSATPSQHRAHLDAAHPLRANARRSTTVFPAAGSKRLGG